MRVFICGLAVLLLLGAAWAQPDPDDDFNITVTVTVLDISLKQSAVPANDFDLWALGPQALEQETEMTDAGDHILVLNGCNVPIDLKVWSLEDAAPACAFGVPTAWQPTMAVGVDDFYSLWGTDVSPCVFDNTNICDGQTLLTGRIITVAAPIAVGVDPHLYFKFQVPSGVSDGCEHFVHVRVVAIP